MASPLAASSALLVDDERYFRRFVSQVLYKQGIGSIIEAENGDAAIELFQLQRPDLVVLDINMPHRDGVDTLSALRALDPDVPIVMLTSIADEMTVERCVIEGATFFIRKDVPAHELSAALVELLCEYSIGHRASA